MNKAVRKIHDDIQHLHKAQNRRRNDAHALNRDEKALKIDQRQRDHERDRFQDNKKDLGKDRDQLQKLLGLEQDKLKPLATQEKKLQAEYDASVDPTTGVGDAELKAQLDAVVAKESRVQARFDTRVEPKRDAIQKLADRVDGQRKDLEGLQREIKGDHREVKQDKKALDEAKGHVHDRRHKALKDLRPAEYKMNLEQTNKVRKELGLESVHHVIRPEKENKKEMLDLMRVAKSYASGRSPGGWCLKKVEDYLEQVSYGKIGHGHIPRFAYAHDFADYLNAGRRYRQLGLRRLPIDNPYDAPPGAIIVVRAGTPGTANPVAGDIVVKGRGDHFYNDGEMGYGGPGNFPKGNNYVLGIYVPR